MCLVHIPYAKVIGVQHSNNRWRKNNRETECWCGGNCHNQRVFIVQDFRVLVLAPSIFWPITNLGVQKNHPTWLYTICLDDKTLNTPTKGNNKSIVHLTMIAHEIMWSNFFWSLSYIKGVTCRRTHCSQSCRYFVVNNIPSVAIWLLLS